ncbi:MAG: hypothetical protein DME96_03995 [Verrucomicrobia bacterium]|nr:MAG: hypothetical protein DME93_09535 [Verrucomicrobiota bacterium]PYJ17999.1 MAG: hypothetical protein DME96_03995 [Verrucomicrobiota bacterium]
MKPTPLTTCNESRRDSFDLAVGKRSRAPITDYNYHSVSFEHSSAKFVHPAARSFWNITGDYLKNEARQDFLGEAALWAVLVLTGFLPLISNAHALMEFVRAISNY